METGTWVYSSHLNLPLSKISEIACVNLTKFTQTSKNENGHGKPIDFRRIRFCPHGGRVTPFVFFYFQKEIINRVIELRAWHHPIDRHPSHAYLGQASEVPITYKFFVVALLLFFFPSSPCLPSHNAKQKVASSLSKVMCVSWKGARASHPPTVGAKDHFGHYHKSPVPISIDGQVPPPSHSFTPSSIFFSHRGNQKCQMSQRSLRPPRLSSLWCRTQHLQGHENPCCPCTSCPAAAHPHTETSG